MDVRLCCVHGPEMAGMGGARAVAAARRAFEGIAFSLSGWRESAGASALARELDAGRGFLWLPVAFGAGVLIYFALPVEPLLIPTGATVFALAALAYRLRHKPVSGRIAFLALAVLAGVFASTVRTAVVAAPMMPRDMTVTVTGWVMGTEETTSGARRIRLAVSEMDRLKPEEAPSVVRITVRKGAEDMVVGDGIRALASISPPGGPVAPGGYDFSRALFYSGIGGTGFAFGAAERVTLGQAPFSVQVRKPLADLREMVRQRIVAALPGDYGHIAAALVMGDQRAISDETQEAMRASGLGHIFSISGLHMALVAGAVFWLIRAALALSSTLALRYPIKKWAAIGAIVVATIYLGISGAEVATVRSYVMLVIMLTAILIDRRALTLHNVAVAALAIMAVSPESLLSISFQMSFAATIALVAAYELIAARGRRRNRLIRDHGWFERMRTTLFAMFVTSLIAGLATAPFGAYYFHRVAPMTIIANMAVAPIVSMIVMPMVLATIFLVPLGLEEVPLWVMRWGLQWMLDVAHLTAGWSYGWDGMRAPTAAGLLLMTFGFLWLCLWRERWRWWGVAAIFISLPVAAWSERPVLIVDDSAKAVAARAVDGTLRILGGRSARFETENWLRADGDARTFRDPSLKDGVRCDKLGCIAAETSVGTVAHILSRDAFVEDCGLARIVVTSLPAPPACSAPAQIVIDRDALDTFGAHAIYLDDNELRVVTAYPEQRRPFMPPGR